LWNSESIGRAANGAKEIEHFEVKERTRRKKKKKKTIVSSKREGRCDEAGLRHEVGI